MATTATVKKLPKVTWLISAVAVVATVLIGLGVGAVSIPPIDALREVLSQLTRGRIESNLSPAEATIIWELRLPRVLLALVVGAMLSSAGCAYQGAFRNPLADPYLLGVSAGAGLGATIVIFSRVDTSRWELPLAAFVGALGAVMLTYLLGRSAIVGRSSTSLVLAGVAVASMLTAVQTLLQQRNTDKIREVYSWVLGRLSTAGWGDVHLVTPYILICLFILILYRRVLDIFSVGDEEAHTMGLAVGRARAAIIVAASLGTAAAVSVTGLIGFVGIIVPHTVRLIVGQSYRQIMPVATIYGGVFLVLADVVARTVLAPQEISIGVITALIGAPFFLFILGSNRHGSIT
jgi:iron complex transport system permease protein